MSNLNWQALTADYNALGTDEVLAFLYMGEAQPKFLRQALLRRGLKRGADFLVYSASILAIESEYMIGEAPSEDIPEVEFTNYACLTGKQYPDPEQHPNICRMDEAIPRRSNHNVTSDTLPRLKNIWQVYIVKMSDKPMKLIVGRG